MRTKQVTLRLPVEWIDMLCALKYPVEHPKGIVTNAQVTDSIREAIQLYLGTEAVYIDSRKGRRTKAV